MKLSVTTVQVALAVAAMLAGLGLLGVLQQYAFARGQVQVLGEQRDGLLVTLSAAHQERDSLRLVGDSVGLVADSLNDDLLEYVDAQEEPALQIVREIVEVVPPEVALMVERADSIRVAQLDSMRVIHVRDSATIAGLRHQLFRERLNSDMTEGVRSALDANLLGQRDAFRRIAQTSWLDDLLGEAVGAAAGAGGMYLACRLEVVPGC